MRKNDHNLIESFTKVERERELIPRQGSWIPNKGSHEGVWHELATYDRSGNITGAAAAKGLWMNHNCMVQIKQEMWLNNEFQNKLRIVLDSRRRNIKRPENATNLRIGSV